MAEALERITNLIALLLETSQPLTLDQIVHDLGQYPAGEAAQRGAFERDKALLRDLGVPIESKVLAGSDAGKTAYWIDRRRYELTDLRLADDEKRALQLAVAASRLDEGEFGLLKLGADGAATSSVIANIPDVPALPVLREAAAQRSEAVFTYRGVPRTLQPYAVLLRDGSWYVIGHDAGHDEARTFRVDRIEGDVSMGAAHSFERPDDFDVRAVFPADPKLLGDAPTSSARVRVDAARARAAAASLGDAAVVARSATGDIEVEVPCVNLDAFRSWLFGFGAHAEVLGPPEVRESVVRWLRELVAAR
jgi:predicted DNA-binding transcriptional regulator YafY